MYSTGFDLAIVGAGILGLAHAYHASKRGLRVLVVERSPRAQGASIRNFGMVWPIGQPSGEMYETAIRSREHWRNLLEEANLWHDPCGSLHLAYHPDEEAVLLEFLDREGQQRGASAVPPPEVARLAPGVRQSGLRMAMHSRSEICVDPREVVRKLPEFLSSRHGVTFRFGTTAVSAESGRLVAGGETFDARQILICSGDDLGTLYPEALGALGLKRCKLQMMRTSPVPDGARIGPMLAAGLTLRHYRSFEGCPTLPSLRARIASESPEFDRFGIHVMLSQNGLGELILGDSHEYDDAIEPFDRPEIDFLVLGYLSTFFNFPSVTLSHHWHGVYVKHPDQPWTILHPAPGVTAVTGVGGAGMTLSFGLAERVVNDLIQ